jgi:hypothetical protein
MRHLPYTLILFLRRPIIHFEHPSVLPSLAPEFLLMPQNGCDTFSTSKEAPADQGLRERQHFVIPLPLSWSHCPRRQCNRRPASS